jgi:hypothetical protein
MMFDYPHSHLHFVENFETSSYPLEVYVIVFTLMMMLIMHVTVVKRICMSLMGVEATSQYGDFFYRC